jgi:hypothetical protein
MTRYADAKPYALPQALADLTGPTDGTAELPRHLDWGPAYVYDLSDEADVAVMYERVIREAEEPADVEMFLNAGVLQRLWSRLVLPPPVRALWESTFRELPQAAA